MRTIGSMILVAAIFLMLLGCRDENPRSNPRSQAFFGGTHKLQRMAQYVSKEGHLSDGGFFLFGTGIANINGKTETRQIIKFAWQANDGTFIINAIPIERVRVAFANVEIPTISFALLYKNGVLDLSSDYLLEHYGPQKLIDEGYILHALLTVKPEDWPIKIQMPLS